MLLAIDGAESGLGAVVACSERFDRVEQREQVAVAVAVAVVRCDALPLAGTGDLPPGRIRKLASALAMGSSSSAVLLAAGAGREDAGAAATC